MSGQAKAQIMSEKVPVQESPTIDQIKKAHRRRGAKVTPSSATQSETVEQWLEFLRSKHASNSERSDAEFQYFPLVNEAAVQCCSATCPLPTVP